MNTKPQYVGKNSWTKTHAQYFGRNMKPHNTKDSKRHIDHSNSSRNFGKMSKT